MSVSLGQFEEKMNKSIESLANEYTTIRAGRANPHVLDRISVDYYGQPTNLQYSGDSALGGKPDQGD